MAPRNDLQLLKELVEYKNINRLISAATLKTFARHTWYLGEILIGFSFYDEGVSVEKKKMVTALN